MFWFAIGFLAGLIAGVPLFLPIAMLVDGIMIEVLHLPKHLSANAELLVMIALYGIWLLMVLATVRLVGKLTWRAPVPTGHAPLAPLRAVPFVLGLLCSLPLPTILIWYTWEFSLQHPR
jgi:hypothetical protein